MMWHWLLTYLLTPANNNLRWHFKAEWIESTETMTRNRTVRVRRKTSTSQNENQCQKKNFAQWALLIERTSQNEYFAQWKLRKMCTSQMTTFLWYDYVIIIQELLSLSLTTFRLPSKNMQNMFWNRFSFCEVQVLRLTLDACFRVAIFIRG